MNKIKILIAHENEEVTKNIADSIETFDNVDIVGVAKDGEKALEEIIEKKPEFVFMEYNFNTISGFELVKKSREKLDNEIPIFNLIISNEIPENELQELTKVAGSKKINSIIRMSYYNDIIGDVMQDYIDFREKGIK